MQFQIKGPSGAGKESISVGKAGSGCCGSQCPRRELHRARGPQVYIAPFSWLVRLRASPAFGHHEGLRAAIEHVIGLYSSPAVSEPDDLGVSGQLVCVLQQPCRRPGPAQTTEQLLTVTRARSSMLAVEDRGGRGMQPYEGTFGLRYLPSQGKLAKGADVGGVSAEAASLLTVRRYVRKKDACHAPLCPTVPLARPARGDVEIRLPYRIRQQYPANTVRGARNGESSSFTCSNGRASATSRSRHEETTVLMACLRAEPSSWPPPTPTQHPSHRERCGQP